MSAEVPGEMCDEMWCSSGGGGGGSAAAQWAASPAAAAVVRPWLAAGWVGALLALLGWGLLVAIVVELIIVVFERASGGGCGTSRLIRKGSPVYFRDCYNKYGPVFKVALGRIWAVVVADPDMMRQVGFKLRNHIIAEPSLMRGAFRRMDIAGLFLAKDDFWRTVRSAWQPAFSAPSLAGYMPRMLGCADLLATRLEERAAAAAAAGGARAEPVNIWRELGSMTLQVVGSTAYGVDFLTMDGGAGHEEAVGLPGDRQVPRDAPAAAAAAGKAPRPPKSVAVNAATTGAAAAAAASLAAAPRADADVSQITAATSSSGRQLMQACADVFRFGGAYTGSRYARAAILLPELRPLLSWLAYTFPDRPLRRVLQARTTLRNTSLDLIADWEAKHTQHSGNRKGSPLRRGGAGGAATAAEPAAPPQGTELERGGAGAAATKAATAAAAAVDDAGGRAPAVEPGSFLGLMLAARDKTSGEALDDEEVAAQVQTFILAGYETTANALTFAIHGIATHPEVERTLLAEIDEVIGPDREPTEDDLPRLSYIEAVFHEALRLYPPAHATTREVGASPLQVGGYTVPPGTPIILAIYTAHNDPRVWPRAGEFIPERFLPNSPLHPEVCARVPTAHAPFGYGTRMCIGWRFAVQEAKLALARLYQRMRFEVEDGRRPLLVNTSLTLSPKGGLWVRPVLRRSAKAE